MPPLLRRQFFNMSIDLKLPKKKNPEPIIDNLHLIPKTELSKEFVEQIVRQEDFYATRITPSGKAVSCSHRINAIGIENISNNALRTMIGLNIDGIGSYEVLKNKDLCRKITTEMALELLEKWTKTPSHKKYSFQKFPTRIITEEFIEHAIEKNPAALMDILPTKYKNNLKIIKRIIDKDPGCFGKIPTCLADDKTGIECLKQIIEQNASAYNERIVKNILRKITDTSSIPTQIIHDIYVKYPSTAGIFQQNNIRINYEYIMERIIELGDTDLLHSQLEHIPPKIILNHLQK